MLKTFSIISLVLWAIGFFAFKLEAPIHILLVLVALAVIVQLLETHSTV